MAKNPKNIGTRQQVLRDHKRDGQVLVPPMAEIMTPSGEVDWAGCLLPELIWLGILNDSYGLKLGSDLALSVASVAARTHRSAKKVWFGPLSSYARLTLDEKLDISGQLSESDHLHYLTRALGPLVRLYPECPMSFLLKDEMSIVGRTADDMTIMKRLIAAFFDRHDTTATLAQANAVYIAFVTDMLKVVEGLALANFPAVAQFPETEESRQVAAGVRCTIYVMFNNEFEVRPTDWAKYFWNRGLVLESCAYPWEGSKNG